MRELFQWKWICLLICSELILTNNGQVTNLDTQFGPLFRFGRQFLVGNFGRRTGHSGIDFQINQRNGKVQKQFSESDEFFCDVNGPGARSPEVPTSVHKLRPGDIDIIGAMGDSLTAGFGGMATNIVHVLTENKGITWSIGGQDTWRKYLTLPNMIKVYNPNLYGYSISDGFSYDRSARFNVAEGGAESRDMPHQAKNLVLRMRGDSNVDINNHWKLVSLMIGDNDYCLSICYDTPEKFVDEHEASLVTALRIIRDNLPRTFVNMIMTPALDILLKFRGRPDECITTHYLECPCLFSLNHIPKRKRLLKVMDMYKKRQMEVINREEFQNRTDFTVALQMFTSKIIFPKKPDGNTDFSYMSSDCFHFSQKGYARATNALWNNMLEPVGQKSQNWKKEFKEFKCPTQERPYFATRLNSV